jgi:hypothetical protein
LCVGEKEAHRRLVAARARANEAGKRFWILPTLMELTDALERGFEDILRSVFDDLVAEGEEGALRLLLATSVAHAVDVGLRSAVAERVVEDAGHDFAVSFRALRAELDTQILGASRTMRGPIQGRLLTHHPLLAAAFLQVAWDSDAYRPALVESCRSIPRAMSLDVDAFALVEDSDFEVLHRASPYLRGQEFFEAAVVLIEEWFAIDDLGRNFLAADQLATCLTDWLQKELEEPEPDPVLVESVATSARAWFEKSIDTARRYLTEERDLCPPRFRFRVYEDHERVACHGWAVLEDTVAHAAADRDLLAQATFLTLLSLDPAGAKTAFVLGSLGNRLLHLGLYEDAARITSALIAVGGSARVTWFLTKELRKLRVEVPPPTLDDAGRTIARLCREVLIPELRNDLWPGSPQLRTSCMRRIAEAALEVFPETFELRELLALVVEAEERNERTWTA